MIGHRTVRQSQDRRSLSLSMLFVTSYRFTCLRHQHDTLLASGARGCGVRLSRFTACMQIVREDVDEVPASVEPDVEPRPKETTAIVCDHRRSLPRLVLFMCVCRLWFRPPSCAITVGRYRVLCSSCACGVCGSQKGAHVSRHQVYTLFFYRVD